MYQEYYGLTEKPFNLTPDPRFLYLSKKHKEAFAHLMYGILHRSGFVMVSGEIGTGKTTICRSLLKQLDPDIEVALIFNPYLSPEELLKSIIHDFGIESESASILELVSDLNEYLLARAAEGKNCVLIIDEAQDLSPEILEQIRLLSNLETETEKLIQIMLIGQPELAQKLELNELRQLNQRITARYHLEALSEEETLQYVAFRLRVAGGRKKVRFTRKAIRSIYKVSGGTPRVINALCDRALLIGYTQEMREITPKIIKLAAKEIQGNEHVRVRRLDTASILRNAAIGVSAAVVVLLIVLATSGPIRFPQATPETNNASNNSLPKAQRTLNPGSSVDAIVNTPNTEETDTEILDAEILVEVPEEPVEPEVETAVSIQDLADQLAALLDNSVEAALPTPDPEPRKETTPIVPVVQEPTSEKQDEEIDSAPNETETPDSEISEIKEEVVAKKVIEVPSELDEKYPVNPDVPLEAADSTPLFDAEAVVPAETSAKKEETAPEPTEIEPAAPETTPESAPEPALTEVQPEVEEFAIAAIPKSDRITDKQLSETKNITVQGKVTGLNHALAALMDAWDKSESADYPRTTQYTAIVRFAVAHGFGSNRIEPTLDQLIALNYPALVEIDNGSGNHWVALLRVEDSNVQVSSATEDTESIPLDSLRQQYRKSAIVFWKDPNTTQMPLKSLDQGKPVWDLQHKLVEIGALKSEPNGVYDNYTAAAVTTVQKICGVSIDGVYGSQTRMILTSWLDADQSPHLTDTAIAESVQADMTARAIVPPPEEIPAASKIEPVFTALEPDESTEDFNVTKQPQQTETPEPEAKPDPDPVVEYEPLLRTRKSPSRDSVTEPARIIGPLVPSTSTPDEDSP